MVRNIFLFFFKFYISSTRLPCRSIIVTKKTLKAHFVENRYFKNFKIKQRGGPKIDENTGESDENTGETDEKTDETGENTGVKSPTGCASAAVSFFMVTCKKITHTVVTGTPDGVQPSSHCHSQNPQYQY